MITALIPVRNEEANVRFPIASLHYQAHPSGQILVITDDCGPFRGRSAANLPHAVGEVL
jgi:hypothetical protein